jgi:hypothetical protein
MTTDRTGELRERMAAVESARDEWFHSGWVRFGNITRRVCRFRAARWLIAGPLSTLVSLVIVRYGVFGVDRGTEPNALDIAANWLRMPTLMHMRYRISSADEHRVVTEWETCPIGFENPDCLLTCETAMNIDMAIVRRLGGRLEVAEKVLNGAPACRIIITPNPAPAGKC